MKLILVNQLSPVAHHAAATERSELPRGTLSDRRSVGRTNYLLKMLQFKRICLLSHFRAPCTKPLGRGAIVHPPDNLPRCGSSALCRLNL